jgi:hypothetical protein
MLKRRKALIGYVTYYVAKQVIKRQASRRISRAMERREAAPPRRRRLPLIGAGLALAAGAVALVARVRR